MRWASSLLAELSRHLSRCRKTVSARILASYGTAELSRGLSRHILVNPSKTAVWVGIILIKDMFGLWLGTGMKFIEVSCLISKFCRSINRAQHVYYSIGWDIIGQVVGWV